MRRSATEQFSQLYNDKNVYKKLGLAYCFFTSIEEVLEAVSKSKADGHSGRYYAIVSEEITKELNPIKVDKKLLMRRDENASIANQDCYKINEGIFDEKLIKAIVPKEVMLWGVFNILDGRGHQLLISNLEKDMFVLIASRAKL